jgi:ankyrin repeat protein
LKSFEMIFRRVITLLIALLMLAGGPLAAREPGERELFEALALDEVAAVRKLLVRGVSSNAVDPEKGPAVVMAAREQSFKSLQVLLESPLTDVNIRNEQGETALMYAVLQGNLEVARALLKRGALINMPGWTPLHYAASAGQMEMAAWLLENHAYIDTASANGTTPLMMAAREGRPTLARYLVEQGADPSLRNQAGLGAPEYFLRRGDETNAQWMATKASEYLRRYGTQAAPVAAPSPIAAPVAAPVAAPAAQPTTAPGVRLPGNR